MVKSKLNNKVNYKEIKSVNYNDIDEVSCMWNIYKFNISFQITLSKEKHDFLKENIIYFIIYLIKDDDIHSQIGVYEIAANSPHCLYDDNNDVNLSLFDDPLLYSYVNETYINSNTSKKLDFYLENCDLDKTSDTDDSKSMTYDSEAQGEDDSEDDSERNNAIIIDDNIKSIITIDKNHIPIELLSIQSKKDALLEREKSLDKNANWVSKYMHNKNYNLNDITNNNDSLYYVICIALGYIGKKTNIYKLRYLISKRVTIDIFKNYKSLHNKCNETKKQLDPLLSDIKKKIQLEKKKAMSISNISNILDIQSLSKELSSIKSDYKEMIEKCNKYKFMDNVNTFKAFKVIVQSNTYSNDDWVLEIFEKAFNIKFIVFDMTAFLHKDYANVLTCILNKDDVECSPSHYIMISKKDNYYQNIFYKNKPILKFQEIPYDIKYRIADKCLETLGGSFNVIQKFIDFKNNLNKMSMPYDEESDYYKEDHKNPSISHKDLHNDDMLLFYSNSLDHKPGEGPGEYAAMPIIYKSLCEYPNWRKKLSNCCSENVFDCDNKQWLSLEHYYQASKFKESNLDFYNLFSLDSDSNISKSPYLAKAAGSICGTYKDKQLRDNSISPDISFHGIKLSECIKKAILAKIKEHDEIKHILSNTGNAKLMYQVRGHPPQLAIELMSIRKLLRDN